MCGEKESPGGTQGQNSDLLHEIVPHSPPYVKGPVPPSRVLESPNVTDTAYTLDTVMSVLAELGIVEAGSDSDRGIRSEFWLTMGARNSAPAMLQGWALGVASMRRDGER